MDAITLTRQLIDIESITGNEAAVGNYLYGELCRIGYQARKIPVETSRFNIYATLPEHPHPSVVFSTHMDTVPPFIPSSEDAFKIYGRGACDAKGIIAAQIAAAERLRQRGIYVGLLFVAGEERDSLGAKVANDWAAKEFEAIPRLQKTQGWGTHSRGRVWRNRRAGHPAVGDPKLVTPKRVLLGRFP